MLHKEASKILDNASGLITRDGEPTIMLRSNGSSIEFLRKPSRSAINAGINHFFYKEMIIQGEL